VEKAAKDYWTQQQNMNRHHSIRFAGETWQIFTGAKKLSTNLKYQLLEHIAGQAVKKYWAEKNSSRSSTSNLLT